MGKMNSINSRNAQKIITRMVSLIARRFQPEKIILFGSYARGDADADSDADLLVVMRNVNDKRKKKQEMFCLLSGIGLPKDIVIATPEELWKYGNIVGTIFYPALREGKILYEKAS